MTEAHGRDQVSFSVYNEVWSRSRSSKTHISVAVVSFTPQAYRGAWSTPMETM